MKIKKLFKEFDMQFPYMNLQKQMYEKMNFGLIKHSESENCNYDPYSADYEKKHRKK